MNETLDSITYDGWELVIRVTGGGVAEAIPRGLSAEVVAARLRHLAIRLDQSVENRATPETRTAPPYAGNVRGSPSQERFENDDGKWGDGCGYIGFSDDP